jgi:ferredoxin-NADP reductase
MLTQVRKPLNGLLRTPIASALLNRLASPRRLDDYLELIDGSWSLDEIRARVIEVRRETRDVTSLWLRPNDNWRGHRAGQHVQLTVTVDGVRRMRSFSLSHAPATNGALRLTIKTRDTGCVSRFVHERAVVGDVVTLSEAQGSFVLPENLPAKLLFVSGGSGLTPLVAMAQQLVNDGYRGSLIWLHSERDVVPLVHELRAFTRQLPDMQLHVHRTSAGGDARHLSMDLLTKLAPDWQQREAFVCGPRGLMTTVKASFAERGLQAHVHSESFQPEWQAPARALSQLGAKSRLVFAKSKIQSDACRGVSLLEQAEHVGLRPLHGCRMGICKTCLCTKLSGSVRNELTGEVSDARDEEIQLCIHTPLSDVSLDL